MGANKSRLMTEKLIYGIKGMGVRGRPFSSCRFFATGSLLLPCFLPVVLIFATFLLWGFFFSPRHLVVFMRLGPKHPQAQREKMGANIFSFVRGRGPADALM